MRQTTARFDGRRTSMPLAAALTSGALLAGLAYSGPSANASCISAFGLSSSADCSSGLTDVAIAIGDGATASAYGWFTGAFAIGDGASALVPAELLSLNSLSGALAVGEGATSTARGILTFAYANGYQAYARSAGLTSLAVTDGAQGHSVTSGVANVAINRGDHADYNWAQAFGVGNLAVNLGGDGRVVAGFDVDSFASVAFNTSGTNTIKTQGGPFAIAGTVDQDGVTVSQTGPGINIVKGATALLRQAVTDDPRPVEPKSTKPARASNLASRPQRTSSTLRSLVKKQLSKRLDGTSGPARVRAAHRMKGLKSAEDSA
ncbi:hypothetical protein [Mycolicibacterium neworleansense]|uniref:Uncharacterized protein n=1 Tax=Mycolicibacterium neworleansense TaxID=146018 RepID=A0A0H5S9F7_9MYCO|nr:hypothetical protein [Mycolicibacterium neworleansense]MCV7365486.1 hypothetical protein [Mycolicibacterium neworleansense]CRZ17974.1 hypothetical protein BN2156_04870 [Mycolicibacterium neworleansense]